MRMCWQVIAAEGENRAAQALREASDIINESSSALQLRYLQTLNGISAEKNSTIIFPLPIEMLTHFMRSGGNNGRDGGKGGSVRRTVLAPSCPPVTPDE